MALPLKRGGGGKAEGGTAGAVRVLARQEFIVVLNTDGLVGYVE